MASGLGGVTTYHIQAWDNSGTGFGPGVQLAEFSNAKNLGWAEYLNDVPEAFFTLNQDDPQLLRLRTYRDKTHIRIFRDSDLVWAGMMGEWDANERDAIIYASGYLSYFYKLASGWNVSYTTATETFVASNRVMV